MVDIVRTDLCFVVYIWGLFAQSYMTKVNYLEAKVFHWVSSISGIVLFPVMVLMYWGAFGIIKVSVIVLGGISLGFFTIPVIKEINSDRSAILVYFIWPVYFLSFYGRLRPYIIF